MQCKLLTKYVIKYRKMPITCYNHPKNDIKQKKDANLIGLNKKNFAILLHINPSKVLATNFLSIDEVINQLILTELKRLP